VWQRGHVGAISVVGSSRRTLGSPAMRSPHLRGVEYTSGGLPGRPGGAVALTATMAGLCRDWQSRLVDRVPVRLAQELVEDAGCHTMVRGPTTRQPSWHPTWPFPSWTGAEEGPCAPNVVLQEPARQSPGIVRDDQAVLGSGPVVALRVTGGTCARPDEMGAGVPGRRGTTGHRGHRDRLRQGRGKATRMIASGIDRDVDGARRRPGCIEGERAPSAPGSIDVRTRSEEGACAAQVMLPS
jgi:hypothetical protein